MQYDHLPETRTDVARCRIGQDEPLSQTSKIYIKLFEERPEALAVQVGPQAGCVKARLKSGDI
jgi:hypothetical protein